MTKFPIKITQVLRVERTIAIDVEAEDFDTFWRMKEDGEITAPPSDDPRWQVKESVENEEIYPAESEDILKGELEDTFSPPVLTHTLEDWHDEEGEREPPIMVSINIAPDGIYVSDQNMNEDGLSRGVLIENDSGSLRVLAYDTKHEEPISLLIGDDDIEIRNRGQ